MVLLFDRSTKIIEVPITDTEVTIQVLLNTCRDYQDELAILDMKNMVNCYGKQPLGGGVYVGLTLELLDGWRIKFADRLGPDYVKCSVSGGNIVGYDASGNEQFPLVPSDHVFATITSASSGTLQESGSIQYSSFGGGVTIDIVNGEAGTSFPIGTIESPVNNHADAISIATERGFNTFFIIGDITLGAGHDVEGFTFEGFGFTRTSIDVDAAALTNKCEFKNCSITGTLDGDTVLNNCKVNTLTYFNGILNDCRLVGPIYLNGGSNAMFYNCGTMNPGSPCTIDMGGSGQNAMFHDYSGGLKFTNLTDDANMIRVQMDGGKVNLDSSIEAGYVIIVGIGILTDNKKPASAGGTCVVNTDGLMSKATIADTIYEEVGEEIQYASFGGQVTIDPVDGSAGTAYPIGTIENPVNNIADALLIAADHGFDNLYFKDDMTITGVDITNYTIIGVSCVHTQIIIDASATSDGITVKSCDLSGTIDGNIKIHNCMIGDLSNVNGYIFNSSLYGTITLGGGADSNIANCFMRRMSQMPAIDMGGSGQNMFLSDWSGAMKVRNMSGPTNSIGFQLDGGRIFIEPTVSAGMVGIVGIGEVVDQSTGTANVDITGLINNDAISNDMWDEPMSEHILVGSFGKGVKMIKSGIDAVIAFVS